MQMVSAVGAAVMRLQNPGVTRSSVRYQTRACLGRSGKVVLEMSALGLRHADYGVKEDGIGRLRLPGPLGPGAVCRGALEGLRPSSSSCFQRPLSWLGLLGFKQP